MAIEAARQEGLRGMLVPAASAGEAAVLGDTRIGTAVVPTILKDCRA